MIGRDQVDKALTVRAWANLETYAAVCNQAGFPWFLALAILEKESGGRNVYGNDKGGALAGYKGDVTESTYNVFRWLVDTQGLKSNGVGPMQITYGGYFPLMAQAGLKPWIPADNMQFGIAHILMPAFLKNRKSAATDRIAFQATAKGYNGGDAYALDALVKADAWAKAVGTLDTLVRW